MEASDEVTIFKMQTFNVTKAFTAIQNDYLEGLKTTYGRYFMDCDFVTGIFKSQLSISDKQQMAMINKNIDSGC